MKTTASPRERLRTWLTGPAVVRHSVALAILLSLPAIGSHRVFDDFVLALGARSHRDAALASRRFGMLDLFTFTNGAPTENLRLSDLGSMLPWWSDPHLQIAFFRPLSAITHLVDEIVYPDRVWLQYVHSLMWLGLLVVAVARLYRALGGSPTVSGLATLLYAVDDAHGASVAWLANRNGLVAAVFGTLSLLVHHRWRATGQRRLAAFAAGLLFLGLLAGESALAIVAYLFAYAALLDRGTFRDRAVSLLPYAVVTSAWAAVYRMVGFAAKNSGLYVDPIADAGRFAVELPRRSFALLGAVLGPIPVDTALFDPAAERRAVAASAVTLSVVGTLILPIVRRDRQARFWAMGMLLATLPASACYPTDRLLLLLGLGAMPLVARILASSLARPEYASSGLCACRVRHVATLVLALVHLVLAPLLLPMRAAQMRLVAGAIAAATQELDRHGDLEHRTLVVVNPPIDPFVSYLQAERALRNVPRPLHLYWLAAAIAPIRITRLGPRTLALQREDGLIASPIERLYRSPRNPLSLGSVTSLTELRAEVVSVTADGRPLEIRFRFAHDLEAPQYLFLVWDGGRLSPFALPSDNETIRLPAQDLAHVVFRTLAGRTR